MLNFNYYQGGLCLAALLFSLFSCGSETEDPCAVEFDQLALLENVADNFISPAYNNLQTKVDSLNDAVNAFCAQPDASKLQALKSSWLSANIAFQNAKIYEFGPAEDYQLRSSLNNYPVFTSRLEYAVSNQTYNLEIDSFAYTRGFPALDYLLHHDSEAQILNEFADTARQNYLKAVSQQIKQKVDWTQDGWSAYANSFKTTEGLAVGSPLSLLVNQLNQNYELFKNNKLGTPVGAKVSYIAAPEKTEAYYSGQSLILAQTTLNASQALFNGGNGQGLDDYLDATAVQKDGRPLSQLINEQFDAASSALDALNGQSLADNIRNNFEACKSAYAQAQNQVVYLKTDLPAVLCINITYADNTDDGD